MRVYSETAGVAVAALCDPDGGRVYDKSRIFPKAKTYSDVRELLDNQEIDAVVVATCPGSGYIAYCEGGRFEGQRGRAVAYDKDNKVIREFKGNSGNRIHQQNFIDCVRSRDASALNTDVEMGNYSTGWCNLANIAFQAGDKYSTEAAEELAKQVPEWGSLHEEMKLHLAAHDVPMSQLSLSPMLEFNVDEAKFSGAGADKANPLLKRQYRAPYVVPEID